MRYLILLLLSGCAAAPYATVGIGHQIDANSDWYLRTDRPWQCHNPQFHGSVGLEFDDGWTIEYHHQSWYGCGKPFNGRAELFTDDVRIMKKFGGK